MNIWERAGFFAGGLLFGTAGLKLLGSKDAKKAYVHATAAVLRVKECVMTTVTSIRENADDILNEAQDINEQRVQADGDEILEDLQESEPENESY